MRILPTTSILTPRTSKNSLNKLRAHRVEKMITTRIVIQRTVKMKKTMSL